jgi:hypothetical protein
MRRRLTSASASDHPKKAEARRVALPRAKILEKHMYQGSLILKELSARSTKPRPTLMYLKLVNRNRDTPAHRYRVQPSRLFNKRNFKSRDERWLRTVHRVPRRCDAGADGMYIFDWTKKKQIPCPTSNLAGAYLFQARRHSGMSMPPTPIKAPLSRLLNTARLLFHRSGRPNWKRARR